MATVEDDHLRSVKLSLSLITFSATDPRTTQQSCGLDGHGSIFL
jgi:hypothetical protein